MSEFTLSIADLERLGYLKSNAFVSGVIRWTTEGRELAAVGAATDTRGVPVLKLAYTYNGEPRDRIINLRCRFSTPGISNGYYYFVCPVTGELCRKLYLVDGEFVGRRERLARQLPYWPVSGDLAGV